MMPALGLHAVAQYSALRVVDSLAEGTVICGFAALLLRVLRRQNAGTRFAIAFSALLAIALMPLTSGVWPHRSLSSAVVNRPALVVPESWALYLFWIWVGVAAFSVLSLGRALWHLHRLRKSCTPVDPATLDAQVQETLRGYRTRKISLCTSEKVRVPTAIGLASPTVVLPRWVLQELSPTELKQVVLHEMAHLRRWDDWTNLAQQLVKAIFFFHPAVWWIEKKLTFEREIACDDAVLAQTSSPRAYAECLTHLVERSFVRRGVALAQAALGHVSQMSERLVQILDSNRPRGDARAWKPAVSLVAGFAVVCAIGVSKAPRLIAFRDSMPGSVPVTAAADSNTNPGLAFGVNAKLVSSRQSLSAWQKPVLAKLSVRERPLKNKLEARGRSAVRHSASAQGSAGSMVHLVSMESSPVTQTLFVFISTGETASPGQPVYQIQMWRVTVLKRTFDTTRHSTPPKKT